MICVRTCWFRKAVAEQQIPAQTNRNAMDEMKTLAGPPDSSLFSTPPTMVATPTSTDKSERERQRLREQERRRREAVSDVVERICVRG